MEITSNWLKEQGACEEGIEEWEQSADENKRNPKYVLKKLQEEKRECDYAYLLHYILVSDLEYGKYLVEQGADIHADGDYPLCLASRYGKLEVVKYLVEQGGDIHADRDYPLRLASEYEQLEVVEYLKEQGGKI
jgi:ankyrin repeat protein